MDELHNRCENINGVYLNHPVLPLPVDRRSFMSADLETLVR